MEPSFPAKIAEKVSEQWTKFASATPGYQPPPCPPLSVLTRLLNTCFFASLKQEEGRVVQFDLALCSPSDLGEPAFRFSAFTKIFNLIRFEDEQPRELSVHELVRLAPACDPEKTVLLTTYDSGEDNLSLWGAVNVDWESGTSFSLSALRIRVTRPGEMKITLHGNHLCTYKQGDSLEPDRGLLNTGHIYAFFKKTSLDLCQEVMTGTGQPVGEGAIPERDERAMRYISVLQRIVDGMQQLKHGGCILIVPEGTTPESLEPNVTIKYRCRDETIWNCLRGKSFLHERFYRSREMGEVGQHKGRDLADLQSEMAEVESGLRDSLHALVRFTAVDGAVLMTRRFELLGFGSVVRAPQAQYQVFRCKDRQATKREHITIEDYGTRHRSAFQFCYSSSPSVALVASQDGGIKTVTRVGNDVYFWENMSFDLSGEV